MDNRAVTVEIYLATEDDIKSSRKKFVFDWMHEYKILNRRVFKMVVAHTKKLEAFMSVTIFPNSHVWVWDVEKRNYKTNKVYNEVVTSFIAYACKISFDNNGKGFVGFTPKSDLYEFYTREVYATELPNRSLEIQTDKALMLVHKYF